MSIFDAILQGIAQGLTEFLPISSSGHLSLIQHFTGTSGSGSLLFSVMLHMGTLLAVFLVYYKTIWELFVEFFSLIKDIFTGKFKWKEMSFTRRMLIMLIFSCVPLLLLMIPVGGGNKLVDVLSVFSEDSDIIVEGVCFLFTATILLIGSHIAKTRKLKEYANTRDAFAIGFGQMLAAGFPGISRSGTTISTGLICGISKEYMVKYSFILGIPAILAANVMELSDAVSANEAIEFAPIIVGVVVAAICGVLAIKALQWIVKKDHFNLFGYYCLILGLIVIGIGIYENVAGVTVTFM